MRISWTARVGIGLLVAAAILFFAGKYWVETRTLRAVNMPISLARGTIRTGTFIINVHAFYSINIVRTEPGNLNCNGVALTTRRLSSLNGLTVYHQPEEQTERSQKLTFGDFLGSFEGRPGPYGLEINVMSDTACLNLLRPRLNIIASTRDFYKLNQRYESSCLASFFLGLLGFIFVIASIYEGLRARSEMSSNPSILNV
jgi:hypothetical protein